jgi:predicted lipid-binding transport protein (Tim44 family)
MDDSTPGTPATPEGSLIQDVNAPTAQGTTSGATDGAAADPATAKAPARPRGPNASAIVIGLVAMLLAGLLIAKETMGLQVDWSGLGPGAIIGIGVVLVVVGVIGLVRRHDDL